MIVLPGDSEDPPTRLPASNARPEPPDIPTWLPTPALSAAFGLMAFLPLLAILLSRPDLVVVAIPIGVATLTALFRRSYQLPRVSAKARATSLLEGESTRIDWEIAADEPLDVVQVRLHMRGWVEPGELGDYAAVTVTPAQPTRYDFLLDSTRWGRAQLEDVTVQAYTAQGLLRADTVVRAQSAIRVLPLRDGFRAVDAVPSAVGVVGLHRSRRPGDGIDLAGVRPFTTGDRLRRINWPVTTRTGSLHVNATFYDRDTEVVLVLDSTVEIGASTGLEGASSAIDQAVRAAASIAEHYLRNGDRVGLLDLSRPGRPIRSRSGRGQLDRLVEDLLEVKASGANSMGVQRAVARISTSAMAIVLSPLLSDDLTESLAGLARAGRSIIVVDTLPATIELPEESGWTQVAWRIEMLRRNNRISSLQTHGVPVVPWLGSGSLDAVLLELSRTAMAPRMSR